MTVIKADALMEAISKRVDAMGVVNSLASAAKMVSSETVETFARSLARLHRPAKINYADKFGVTVPEGKPVAREEPVSSGTGNEAKNISCESCGVEVESKVVYFCRMNKAKFGGKILCQTCQRKPLPVDEPEIIELTETAGTEEKGTVTCEKCGTSVDRKVAYFCRINKKRFGGKILCRTCQVT